MRISIIAFATALMFSVPAIGQERGRGGPPDPGEMIERLMKGDENGDGKLSKDEVEKVDEFALRLFEDADGDKDGFITPEEIEKALKNGPPGMGPGGRGGPGGGRGGRGGPGGIRMMGGPEQLLGMMPVIKALDADGDNELSSEEIENAVAALKELDKDEDGKISTREMMPDMSRMMRGGRGMGGMGQGREGEPKRSTRPRRPSFDDDKKDGKKDG